MSNENKAAVNLYGILDNELARMHGLLQTYLALPKDPTQYMPGSYSSNTTTHSHSGLGKIYDRINQIQDILIQALIAHDKELQEKIAELALTGDADETISTR